MSLFEELKRRRVLRLIGAYLVVAWLLVQVVTAIEEPLRLPDWFDTAVIVLLGLGFPIAIIISWVYDVTPDGVVREDGTRVRSAGPDYGKISLGAVIALGAFLGGTYITNTAQVSAPDARPQDLQEFVIGVPQENRSSPTATQFIAISADGRTVFLTGRTGGQSRIYSRAMHSVELAPVEGANGDSYFDISPNGQTIAFAAGDGTLLSSVPVSGGIVTPIARASRSIKEIAWLNDDTLIYKDWTYDGLHRLTVGQPGDPVLIDSPVEGQLLKHVNSIPDSGWAVLVVGERGMLPRAGDRLAFMSPDGEIHVTEIAGASPKVTANGDLLFYRGNAIWHARLDIEELAIENATPLIANVKYDYFGYFDISDRGDLVYRRTAVRGSEELVWVDHQGQAEPLPMKSGHYRYPRFDSDGDLLALIESDESGTDLWVYSLGRNESTRLTSTEFRETNPVWDVDGEHIFYESGTRINAFRIAIDGVGEPEQITNSSQSGEFEYLLRSDDRESHPALSPDGSLIAYMSNRSGELEVYVRRFPFTDDEEIRVSNSGDCWIPRWNADGTEVFCWDRDDETMYGTEISTSPSLQAALPTPLFNTEDYVFDGIGNYDYDVSRDQFVMVKKPPPGSTEDEIVLIQNWPALLNDVSATP
jgi:Tol biopolymer transport system component